MSILTLIFGIAYNCDMFLCWVFLLKIKLTSRIPRRTYIINRWLTFIHFVVHSLTYICFLKFIIRLLPYNFCYGEYQINVYTFMNGNSCTIALVQIIRLSSSILVVAQSEWPSFPNHIYLLRWLAKFLHRTPSGAIRWIGLFMDERTCCFTMWQKLCGGFECKCLSTCTGGGSAGPLSCTCVCMYGGQWWEKYYLATFFCDIILLFALTMKKNEKNKPSRKKCHEHFFWQLI